MVLVQKEVKAVYMWKEPYTDYSAMQGPCPDGFHIPSASDRNTIKSALSSLDANYYYYISQWLKMPYSGTRSYNNGSTAAQGSQGYYRTHKYSGTDANYMLLTSSSFNQNTTTRTTGASIRAIKNTPSAPDSSWEVIYQGTGSAGIYWNSTLGLISISRNGTTRYTIQDKNLGATQVYNSGDTLSEANCGKYYQWGNNYGFPRTGSVTTSSTQVNASSYGPGNYYSSSTFIIRSSSPYDRSSVQNDNLWGGVTGAVTGGGDVLIRPTIKPVSVSFGYTGADQVWEVPYTQEYIITACGAGSNTAAGGLGRGTLTLNKGDKVSIVVGQAGSSTSSCTYGFGGSSNYSSNRAGGGLSGVFTGDSAVGGTDSARALIIGGGAGGGTSSRCGGAGGGLCGCTGCGSNYGTAGGGGTQTGRLSGGNVGSQQFRGGNGSGTYGWGGGGGWYGGNGSIGDGSGDDDKGAGGGSGYVVSSATNTTLTAGGGAAMCNNGCVTIVSVLQ